MALNLSKPQSRAERAESDVEDRTRVIRRQSPVSSSTFGNGHAPANIQPISSQEIMDGDPLREFILLAGKDSVGKSCAVVSLAWYVENILNPEAKFYSIDSENKLRTAIRSFGADAPTNIVYYKADNMNQVTWAADQVLKQHKPGD